MNMLIRTPNGLVALPVPHHTALLAALRHPSQRQCLGDIAGQAGPVPARRKPPRPVSPAQERAA